MVGPLGRPETYLAYSCLLIALCLYYGNRQAIRMTRWMLVIYWRLVACELLVVLVLVGGPVAHGIGDARTNTSVLICPLPY